MISLLLHNREFLWIVFICFWPHNTRFCGARFGQGLLLSGCLQLQSAFLRKKSDALNISCTDNAFFLLEDGKTLYEFYVHSSSHLYTSFVFISKPAENYTIHICIKDKHAIPFYTVQIFGEPKFKHFATAN